jgi:hypothetical protein
MCLIMTFSFHDEGRNQIKAGTWFWFQTISVHVEQSHSATCQPEDCFGAVRLQILRGKVGTPVQEKIL